MCLLPGEWPAARCRKFITQTQEKWKSDDLAPLTSTTMPSCRGPLVLRVSFSPSMEYSHCKPVSRKFFDSASSLFAFSMKFPVTWFFTAVSNEGNKKISFFVCWERMCAHHVVFVLASFFKNLKNGAEIPGSKQFFSFFLQHFLLKGERVSMYFETFWRCG